MNADKLASLIGFSIRAGKSAFGSGNAERAAKYGRAKLIFLDSGAAANTRKKIVALCANNHVRLVNVEAGYLQGVTARDNVMVLTVLESGFAKAMAAVLDKT